FYLSQGADGNDDTGDPDKRERDIETQKDIVVTVFLGGRNDPYIVWNLLLAFLLDGCAAAILWGNLGSRRGWLAAFGCLLFLVRLGVSLYREYEQREREDSQYLQHDGENVSQKLLTFYSFRNTFNTSRL